MYYVLIETNKKTGLPCLPLGVFNTAKIPNSILNEEYGEFTIKEHVELQNHGKQWIKTIIDENESEIELTLYFYEPNRTKK